MIYVCILGLINFVIDVRRVKNAPPELTGGIYKMTNTDSKKTNKNKGPIIPQTKEDKLKYCYGCCHQFHGDNPFCLIKCNRKVEVYVGK